MKERMSRFSDVWRRRIWSRRQVMGKTYTACRLKKEFRSCVRLPRRKYIFLSGGTQANLTVIAAALRPHQSAIGAVTAHINGHETGAVEATGHKILTVPSLDGKLTASQVEELYREQVLENDAFEHVTKPKLVYISNPTELGTIYHERELRKLHEVCQRYGLYLYMDGHVWDTVLPQRTMI